MKRTLAITLTVAMIGTLAFMGLAGTAAAGEYPKDDNDVDPIIVEDDGVTVNQEAFAGVIQDQNVEQSNVGVQTAQQNANQEATGIDGDANVNVNVGDNDNNDNNPDSTNVEVGTTGDQSIDQSISQSQSQSNVNNQVGGAAAVNIIG
ncbi:hypothetical protein [Natrarchaeobius oligotrophus]|uniref:hypothetical protein n=1 Tax=Natrarchaeobius oligotrophus TaxID=3455743 RepID=UPI001A9FF5BB|nr:hypothetical protein [Natrarchaeobius chitinivorans]